MITNEETTLKERLAEVMRVVPSGICHAVTNKSGITGVKFDQGIYKGKFMPLNTYFDIRLLKIYIDQTIFYIRREKYNDDDMINLFTDEFDDVEPDYGDDEDGDNYDPITGLPLSSEDRLVIECEKSTRKIIDNHGYSEYFDYIATPNGKFCGVVFWDPHKPIKETDKCKKLILQPKSRPQVIKFNNPYTEEVDEYFSKLCQCIDIIKEFEDDVADFVEYAKKHCREEEDTNDSDPKNEVDKEKIQEFVKKGLLPIIDHILSYDK